MICAKFEVPNLHFFVLGCNRSLLLYSALRCLGKSSIIKGWFEHGQIIAIGNNCHSNIESPVSIKFGLNCCIQRISPYR